MGLTQLLLFAVIIMCTYFIEGMIGFGGTIMAIPLASAVVGLKLTVPVLRMIVVAASLIIVLRDFKYICKKEYFRIASIMLIGLPIGMWLFSSLPERPLKIALGVFMVFVAIKGILTSKKTTEQTQKPLTGIRYYLQYVMIFLGGIFHGAFASGGPFVVVYATKAITDKTAFRVTLCALWATLDGITLTLNATQGVITPDMLVLAAITMLFVLFAIYTSNIAHKKVDATQFTRVVYIALLVSGILMIR